MQLNVSVKGTRTQIIAELKGLAKMLGCMSDTSTMNMAPSDQPYRITLSSEGQGSRLGLPRCGVKVIGQLEDGSVQIVSRIQPVVDLDHLASLPIEQRHPELVMEHWVDSQGVPCSVTTWCYLPMFAGPTPRPPELG